MHLNLHTQGHIAHLIFDRQDSAANIFDRSVLLELDSMLDSIPKNATLSALIISSAKPSIFIAGADLKTLASASPEEMSSLISLGQNVFNKLENLHITTVAAIHGACVGGGYELALACDYRVASDAGCTRIGLPETQLGILPAWGGSTRLPSLIGLTKALPLILGGKIVKAASAQHKGLVDGVCPQEHLLEYAERFITRPKRKHTVHALEHNPLSVAVIRKTAGDDLEKKAHGHYPALTRALDVACDGVRSSLQDSLNNERKAILELILGPEAKQLITLFFLSEKSKKLRITDVKPRPLNKTAVIGSGVMGAGIAYWLSTRSRHVILKDINDDALAKGMNTIETLYQGSMKRRILSKTEASHGLDSIHASSAHISLADRDIIIEAATENLELKKKVFATLSEQSSSTTILATNTSALPIHELIAHVSHPERLVGIHFFNPVPRMKLVEVVRTTTTSDETLAAAVKFVQSIGKLPVVVNDSPGFVVNRILLPYLVRAGELFADGHAPEIIDQAMLDFGMPMGPLRLLDEIGLDVSLHVAKTLSEAFPERMKIPAILVNLVEQGLTGKKSGAGFYLYEKGDAKPNPAIQPGASPESSILEIQQELVQLMSAEAARCLDEGVADSADTIDFAMVMGTGYAPFRGGPLRHAHDTALLDRQFY